MLTYSFSHVKLCISKLNALFLDLRGWPFHLVHYYANNDHCCDVKAVKQFFEVEVIAWPAQSPGCNPIEIIGDNIRVWKLTTTIDLWQKLKEKSDKITPEQSDKLDKSCEQVSRRLGLGTSYEYQVNNRVNLMFSSILYSTLLSAQSAGAFEYGDCTLLEN